MLFLSMPYINDSDRADIVFGCGLGYDFIAASFVRCKEDILELRKILEENNSAMKVIAKIENMQGIQNLEEILSVSDGIMVARGDMGVEIPLEDVPATAEKDDKDGGRAGKTCNYGDTDAGIHDTESKANQGRGDGYRQCHLRWNNGNYAFRGKRCRVISGRSSEDNG